MYSTWDNIPYTPWEMREENLISLPPSHHQRCLSCIFPFPDSFFSASRSLQKKNNAVMREVLFYRGLPHFLLPNWQNDSKSGNRTFSRFCTCMCKSVSELAVRHNSPPEGLQPPSILCYVHPNCRNSSCYLIIDTILHGALTKKFS